jgi:hypothetical protein
MRSRRDRMRGLHSRVLCRHDPGHFVPMTKHDTCSREVLEIEKQVVKALRTRFADDTALRDELINLLTEAVDTGRKMARPQ